MDDYSVSESNNFKEVIESIKDGLYIVDKNRKIIYWNKASQDITGYSSKEVIGSNCHDNILIHVNNQGCNLCKSNCPLQMTIEDGKEREAEVFLHHKNGHRVPVNVRTNAYRNAKGQIVGGIELFSDISNRELTDEKIERLKSLAFVDKLTQIPNRAYLEIEIEAKIAEFNRIGSVFGLIFMDIDFFKKFNDNYGHDVGDKVLQTVGSTVSANTRPSNTFGRWGGEEFVGIFNVVDALQLKRVSEKYRMLISRSYVEVDSKKLNITISGGSTLVQKGDTSETLVKRADALMYKSKQSGRNKISYD